MKNNSFLKRLRYACAGLKKAWNSEGSLRTEVYIGTITLIALILLQPDLIWWAIILLAIALVIAAELINTAIEHLADHLHPAQHPMIAIVKDCAAAAVLILSSAAAMIFALLVWTTLAP